MMLVCLIILQFLLTKTAFGRSIYAIGTNEKTAQACGIKTGKIKIQVFLISGIMAGLAAIALTARISSSSLSLASDGTSLDVIAAAIVGGASIKGGVGTVLGALIGLLLLMVFLISWYYLVLIIIRFRLLRAQSLFLLPGLTPFVQMQGGYKDGKRMYFEARNLHKYYPGVHALNDVTIICR